MVDAVANQKLKPQELKESALLSYLTHWYVMHAEKKYTEKPILFVEVGRIYNNYALNTWQLVPSWLCQKKKFFQRAFDPVALHPQIFPV